MSKTCLVTGGFGFLGSHLVDRLLAGGDRVRVIDDMSSPAVGRDERDGLSWSIAKVGEALWRERYVDEIYHLASPVGPVGVLSQAGRIAPAIIADVGHVVELAERCNARLLCVSTSEVYGGGRAGLCAEVDACVVPAKVSARLEYAVGKLAAEIAILNRASPRAVIVRPFNIAGPRQQARGGFVLPRFVAQALAGEPLTVYGDGNAVRALTHVSDVASGLVRALRLGYAGTVYNLGNAANKTTILELARRVIACTGSASKIVHVNPKELHGAAFEDASDKFPDSTRAELDFDWAPAYDLDAIIADTVAYARSAA